MRTWWKEENFVESILKYYFRNFCHSISLNITLWGKSVNFSSVKILIDKLRNFFASKSSPRNSRTVLEIPKIWSVLALEISFNLNFSWHDSSSQNLQIKQKERTRWLNLFLKSSWWVLKLSKLGNLTLWHIHQNIHTRRKKRIKIERAERQKKKIVKVREWWRM